MLMVFKSRRGWALTLSLFFYFLFFSVWMLVLLYLCIKFIEGLQYS